MMIGICVQEVGRIALWKFHRYLIQVLRHLSKRKEGCEWTREDDYIVSLTHGCAHGMVHAAFFCISWLPLSYNGGTIYLSKCPQISFFILSSSMTLGFSVILVAIMILTFEGWWWKDEGNVVPDNQNELFEERNVNIPLNREYAKLLAPTLVHSIASSITFLNLFVQDGCMLSLPLLYSIAAICFYFSILQWWKDTCGATDALHQVPEDDDSLRSNSETASLMSLGSTRFSMDARTSLDGEIALDALGSRRLSLRDSFQEPRMTADKRGSRRWGVREIHESSSSSRSMKRSFSLRRETDK